MPAWLGVLCLVSAGCAAARDRPTADANSADSPQAVVVSYGRPHAVLDGVSDALSLPVRLLMPNEPDKRKVTPETIDKLSTYLEESELADVHVAVRQYAPRDEWRRLRDNKHLGWANRYSLGVLGLVGYTVLPGRLLGRNAYNPYTNTLYVNSDRPGTVMGEAAYAKNVRRQRAPGLYALGRELPLVSIVPALDSGREVIRYARDKGDWELEQEAYPAAYARIGAEAGAGAALVAPPIMPIAGWMSLAGAAAGNVAGRHVAARRAARRDAGSSLEPHTSDGGVQQASFTEPADP